MSAKPLTPMQARFVRIYCQTGNATQAAIDAGYTEATADGKSWAMIRKPAIVEAIRIETQACLDAGVALGKKVLIDLAEKATSETVRLQAGLALLDRGGLRLKHLSEHLHTHKIQDERTDAELRERIRQLSGELGLPVARLIQGERLPALNPPALDISDAELVPEDIFA